MFQKPRLTKVVISSRNMSPLISKCTFPSSFRYVCANTSPERSTSCPIEYDKKRLSSMITIVQKLGKMRLTAFVAASSVAGAILSDAPLSHTAILFSGVTSISLSANTANQCLEVKEDSTMNRTKLRPLVTGEISMDMAQRICATEFILGSCLLYLYSPAACALGVFNWALYVLCYTPAKKLTIYNTEIGAFVGAIPPLMGSLHSAFCLSNFHAAVWLGTILYIWQIPHFVALSFLCRKDYLSAGYMMQASFSVEDSLRKFLLSTAILGSIVLLGPWYLELGYPTAYYYASSILFSCLMVKSTLFCYSPSRFCRDCFIYSYVWLGIQLILIITSHRIKSDVEKIA